MRYLALFPIHTFTTLNPYSFKLLVLCSDTAPDTQSGSYQSIPGPQAAEILTNKGRITSRRKRPFNSSEQKITDERERNQLHFEQMLFFLLLHQEFQFQTPLPKP